MVEKPWHANFPVPKAELRSLSHDQVAATMVDEGKVAGRDYLVVVRRTDFAVPSLGSLIIPEYSRPVLCV
jgi:arsenical-resistance protein 2